VKARFGHSLSWADLIVLAGTVALEEGGAPPLPFCPGRADAAEGGEASEHLEPVVSDRAPATVALLREAIARSGLTTREWVALSGWRGMGPWPAPFIGAPTAGPGRLGSAYFASLADLGPWEAVDVPGAGVREYAALSPSGEAVHMLETDMALLWDPEAFSVVVEFASDEAGFQGAFGEAWTKLMEAGRFDGPTGNACDGRREFIPRAGASRA